MPSSAARRRSISCRARLETDLLDGDEQIGILQDARRERLCLTQGRFVLPAANQESTKVLVPNAIDVSADPF
jgi:hypothetical protein